MKLKYDVIQPKFWSKRNLNPIIFLHGLADTRRSWKKVGPIIVQKTGRKAYALDARNHGESPLSEEMNYDQLTQDVVDFMNEHNIAKAVIVGHSMGGRTAINFALKHPERTEVLVVEDMTPKNVSSGVTSIVRKGFDLITEYLKNIPPETDLSTSRRAVLELLMEFAHQFQKCEDVERFYRNWDLDMIPLVKIGDAFVTECDLNAMKMMLESNALVQNLPEKNLKYDGDALFLYGDLGFFNLGRDSSIKKLFPRAILKKFQGASHLMHLEFPDVFAEVVSYFILHRNLRQAKL